MDKSIKVNTTGDFEPIKKDRQLRRMLTMLQIGFVIGFIVVTIIKLTIK